jgi:hypothetical protein
VCGVQHGTTYPNEDWYSVSGPADAAGAFCATLAAGLHANAVDASQGNLPPSHRACHFSAHPTNASTSGDVEVAVLYAADTDSLQQVTNKNRASYNQARADCAAAEKQGLQVGYP